MASPFLPQTPDELHHAYIVVGTATTAARVARACEELGIRVQGNSDVVLQQYETLGIDDSRELVRRAHLRPIGDRALVIVSAQQLTREAQNSLLKLFEEPPAHTHFFLCISNPEYLLPTLRSRMAVVYDDTPDDAYTPEAASFVAGTPAQRLAVVAPYIDDKRSADAEQFLHALEVQLSSGVMDTQVRQALQHIGAVRRHLYDRGASLKALLESVVVVCP